eukprot:3393221-Pyramimonas_sp.AAC.1
MLAETRAPSRSDSSFRLSVCSASFRTPTTITTSEPREARALSPSMPCRSSLSRSRALMNRPSYAGTCQSSRGSRWTNNLWWQHLDRHSRAWIRLRGLFSRRWSPWTTSPSMRNGTIISWNARSLLCYRSRRRKAKMNKLVSFMRKKAVILLQECRGTLPKLQAALATYPYPYKIFHNHLSQKAGGTAFLVPLADRDQEDPQ